jgi:hypothetical protein
MKKWGILITTQDSVQTMFTSIEPSKIRYKIVLLYICFLGLNDEYLVQMLTAFTTNVYLIIQIIA